MSTSGGTIVNAVLYLVGVMVSGSAAVALTRSETLPQHWRGVPHRERVVTAATWLAVALPSALQIPYPRLYEVLRRDPDLILHHGQVWRVLTSVVQQDGGIGGTLFNLGLLAFVLLVAGPVYRSWTPLVFVVCHLVFNIPATLFSSETGAGNSGATFGLAASVTGLAAAVRWTRGPAARAGGVVAVGLVLLWLHDAHGVAFVGGALLGAVIGVSTKNSLIGAGVWQDVR